MASAKKEKPQEPFRQLNLNAGELLAALSYATDITPSGCHFHSWRVALVAERIAQVMLNDNRRDVFLAGLLHDTGAVGAYRHITYYRTIRQQLEDIQVRAHAQRGAAIVEWLPGMHAVAECIANHHEWYNGGGYPEGKAGNQIPTASQILLIADVLDIVGCFRSVASLRSTLPGMADLTGSAWGKEIWQAFVQTLEDGDFYSTLTDSDALAPLIKQKLEELGVPETLAGEEGAERALHLFAALVDLKDPSTSGHSLRTARRAEILASHMKLSDAEAHLAYRAGLVHDCGRLGIEGSLLNRAGRLTVKEMDVVRKHAEMTIRVFECLPDCPDMREFGYIAGHDHERWDGKGYPDRLAGEDIPLIARIISVVDAYDSMVAPNEYRLLTTKGALVRLEQNAGSQFDPTIVKAMIEVTRSGHLDEAMRSAA
ncbi:MAG: HD domain-containing phosphohydrolase [Armatimonadota bacterium]|nr:HD domain-containing phosphohydrolase [Armatimonadota bacterium]